MPASSEAQKKFFALVGAVKSGAVSPSKVTSNVRQAAKDTSKDDIADFTSTSSKNLPDRVTEPKEEGMSVERVMERYAQYGSTLRRGASLTELSHNLMDMVDYAEHAITNEMADDWFDAHTIKRNIKEMRGYVKEFEKLASEADANQFRMTALYDDLGRIFERYFNLHKNPQAKPEQSPHTSHHAQSMNERVVDTLRTRLNEAQQKRFDSLPKEKQITMAWRVL